MRTGRAHAALVVDLDGRAQGWCQYASMRELELRHQRAYQQDPPPPARWRIGCVFVDRRHRGEGVARVALAGALGLMALDDGGRVEAVSEVTTGPQAQGRFQFTATVTLFEEFGFTRELQVGQHAWIVGGDIEPA